MDREVLTQLLNTWQNDQLPVDQRHEARDKLFAYTYEILQSKAHLIRRSDILTLDTAGLIGEAYIRLNKQVSSSISDLNQFFGQVAKAMRHAQIDYWREKQRAKRGGDLLRVSLFTDIMQTHKPEDILKEVGKGLDWLGRQGQYIPTCKRIVTVLELCGLGGFTHKDAADLLGVSTKTIQTDWKKGIALLKCYLEKENYSAEPPVN